MLRSRTLGSASIAWLLAVLAAPAAESETPDSTLREIAAWVAMPEHWPEGVAQLELDEPEIKRGRFRVVGRANSPLVASSFLEALEQDPRYEDVSLLVMERQSWGTRFQFDFRPRWFEANGRRFDPARVARREARRAKVQLTNSQLHESDASGRMRLVLEGRAPSAWSLDGYRRFLKRELPRSWVRVFETRVGRYEVDFEMIVAFHPYAEVEPPTPAAFEVSELASLRFDLVELDAARGSLHGEFGPRDDGSGELFHALAEEPGLDVLLKQAIERGEARVVFTRAIDVGGGLDFDDEISLMPDARLVEGPLHLEVDVRQGARGLVATWVLRGGKPGVHLVGQVRGARTHVTQSSLLSDGRHLMAYATLTEPPPSP